MAEDKDYLEQEEENKEDYEKEFIHGSCVAAEFVHVYLLRLR